MKTDKVGGSAQLLAARYLPSVSMPDAATSGSSHTQPLRKIAQIADTTLYTRSRSPTPGRIVLDVARDRHRQASPERLLAVRPRRTAPGSAGTQADGDSPR